MHIERNDMKKVTDVLVVGGGYSGLLAAVNIKAKAPALNVQVLRHPIVDDFSTEILATTSALPAHLLGDLGVNGPALMRGIRPTFTLGTRYEWGPRDFFDWTYEFQVDTKYAKLSHESGYYVGDGARAFEAVGPASALMSAGRVFLRGPQGQPQMNINRVGYHVNPRTLEKFLEGLATGLGVILRDGRMAEAIRGEEGLSGIRLETGEVLAADIFVDATGLQSLLLGKALGTPFHSFAPGLACDRAIVASWARGDQPIRPHSSVRAMEAGWCWQIDSEQIITCGHGFSSAHTDAAAAEGALRALYPKCGVARVLSFSQGRYEKSWNGNVLGVGNAAGFIEPLASAGTAVLAFQCQWFAQTLVDCDRIIRPTLMKQFNKRWQRLLEGEREFLGLFYRFNNRTERFWSDARERSHLGDLDIVVRCYEDLGPDSVYRATLLHELDPINCEGYYSVLIGQKAPWTKRWEPSAEELQIWQMVQENWRRKAAMAFTFEEAMAVLLGAPANQGGGARRAMAPVG
jgi:tryptophan halogenase